MIYSLAHYWSQQTSDSLSDCPKTMDWFLQFSLYNPEKITWPNFFLSSKFGNFFVYCDRCFANVTFSLTFGYSISSDDMLFATPVSRKKSPKTLILISGLKRSEIL